MDLSIAQKVVVAVIPTMLAITVHEASHAYAALWAGDDTAKRMGRLTLNPFKHIDLIGTVLLPAVLILTGAGFFFGWAKPVPIRPVLFRKPHRDILLVSAAGPGSNFLMMIIWGLLLKFLLMIGQGAGELTVQIIIPIVLMCQRGIEFNAFLGIFNLIPIPPLDGGRILTELLPDEQARSFAQIERYGILIVLMFVMLVPGFIGTLVRPLLSLLSVIIGIPVG